MANSEFELLIPQFLRIPEESLTGSLGDELLDTKYDRVEWTFSDAVNQRIVRGMEAFVTEQERGNGGRAAKRARVAVRKAVGALLGNDTRAATATISALTGKSLDLETIDVSDPDFQDYVGMLSMVDEMLRVGKGKGGLRDALAGLSADELEGMGLGHIMGEFQGDKSINFQDPVKAEKDMRDAVEKMRMIRNKNMVVWVPPDFYHSHQGDNFSRDEWYIPNTRLIKPEYLNRPVEAVMVAPGEFTITPIAERQLTNELPLGMQTTVHKFQTLRFISSLINGDGGAQQYLRTAQGFFRAEGLLAGTLVKEVMKGASKAQQFFAAETAGIDDKAIGGLAESTLTPVEQAAVLLATRTPLVAEMEGNEIATAEIGVARIIDRMYGDNGAVLKNGSGQELYVRLGETPMFDDDGKPINGKTMKEFLDDDVSPDKLWPLFAPGDDPFATRPVLEIQPFYTMDPLQREEVGGGFWIDAVVSELKRNGLDVSKFTRFRGELFNNGEMMSVDDPVVVRAVAEKGISRDDPGYNEAAFKHLLTEVLFVNHVGELVAAVGLTMQWQRDERADPILAADFVPESRIASTLRELHTRKYGNGLPESIQMMRQYHKEVEFWKQTSIDWMLFAVDAKDGFRAVWRNSLNPDDAPEVAPILYKDETKPLLDDDGEVVKDEDGNDIHVGVSIKEKIKQLTKSGTKEDLAEAERLKKGQKLIKAILYAKDPWGSDPVYDDMTSALLWTLDEAAKEPNEARAAELRANAKKLSGSIFELYVNTYDDLAPSGYRRSIKEIMGIMEGVLENEKLRSMLEAFNFVETLKSVGDVWMENMEDEDLMRAAGWSVQGFMRGVRHRRTETNGVWGFDKPGKYTVKYPMISAEQGKMLLGVQEVLINSLDPRLMSAAFGLPDQLAGLNSDSAAEMIGKTMYNFLLSGRRTKGETGKFLEEIIEGVLPALKNPGTQSSDDYWGIAVDKLKLVNKMSQGVIRSHRMYEKRRTTMAKGQEVEAADKDQGLKLLGFDRKDPYATRLVRRAGMGTAYPDPTSGKKQAYVHMGTRPLYLGDVRLDEVGKLVYNDRDVAHLENYDHHGAELLTIALIAVFAKDKGFVPREILAPVVVESLGKKVEDYGDFVEKLYVVMDRLAEEEARSTAGETETAATDTE